MTTYRVTYVDSVLRETIVKASTPEQAEDKARSEIESATHHHAVDVWQDDWHAEEYAPRTRPTSFAGNADSEGHDKRQSARPRSDRSGAFFVARIRHAGCDPPSPLVASRTRSP